MWFKILQLAQVILSCILEAEIGSGRATGAEKKGTVMKTVSAELRKEGLLGGNGDAAGDALLKSVGGVVDGFVELLHITGAFSHATAHDEATEAAPEAEPPTGD